MPFTRCVWKFPNSSHLRGFHVAWTLLLLLAASACAAPVLPIPQVGQGDPAPAADPQGIARESLLAMYQTELGDRFHADQGAALYQTHALIESFFATPGMG